jgi:glutathione peroxidase
MSNAYEFSAKAIDGRDVNLSTYRGKVALVVNVASKCGLTSQYKGLEELHETFAAKGLAVLGFPANEFGKQEPGTDQEIQSFCTTNYGVGFDMFSKVVVKGEGIHPLFAYLTDKSQPTGGEIGWNFAKFLVGKHGEVIARFEPTLSPTDPKVIAAIEAALAAN